MSRIKILIVDDDQNICELLRLYVEKDGYEAVVVNDGAAALAALTEHNPKLILLDIMLPKLDIWYLPSYPSISTHISFSIQSPFRKMDDLINI